MASSRWDWTVIWATYNKMWQADFGISPPQFFLWTAHYHCNIQHFFLCQRDRQYSYSSWVIAFLAESMAWRHEKEAVLSQLYLSYDYTETIKLNFSSLPSSQADSQPSFQTSVNTQPFCTFSHCHASHPPNISLLWQNSKF